MWTNACDKESALDAADRNNLAIVNEQKKHTTCYMTGLTCLDNRQTVRKDAAVNATSLHNCSRQRRG